MPGLLARLLGQPSAASTQIVATVFPGHETLEVVGESHHQEVLWQLVGGFRSEPVRHPCRAILLPEPDNPADSNAIRVLVDGSHVGYLSRNDAEQYLPGLLRLTDSCETGYVALPGQIVGGGPRGNGVGSLGVFLDHEPADFGLTPNQRSWGGNLRTGLSEALATDLEDDRYDLSWLRGLPADVESAIEQLRLGLQSESDPIDRHYLLCELEDRLYKCRSLRASALKEFDAVAEQHHAEMPVIRSALLDKFGVVPVIEVYRQASIRCQKAKQWHGAQQWAQRGLDVYADRAARPDAVEDLHRRVAHATAKLEEAS